MGDNDVVFVVDIVSFIRLGGWKAVVSERWLDTREENLTSWSVTGADLVPDEAPPWWEVGILVFGDCLY